MELTTASPASTQEASLSVYFKYDLTGGGPPFGHVRTFRVELSLGRAIVVRNASAATQLLKLVEQLGKSIGEKEFFPYDRGYADTSYSQRFTLPA